VVHAGDDRMGPDRGAAGECQVAPHRLEPDDQELGNRHDNGEAQDQETAKPQRHRQAGTAQEAQRRDEHQQDQGRDPGRARLRHGEHEAAQDQPGPVEPPYLSTFH
jgi:hypothetical protein